MKTMTDTIEEIMIQNSGKIYSINDFYNIGTKNTVKSILYRLEKEGKVARLIDGLYTRPKYSEILKEYSYPNINLVAEKIADKYTWQISPTEDLSLNYTGLSTQVPNNYMYVSDGPYRTYNYRNKKIIFKHTSNRNITAYSKEYSILIQAIKTLGKTNIGEKELEKFAIYSQRIKEDLTHQALKLPFWIQEILKKIEVKKYEQFN